MRTILITILAITAVSLQLTGQISGLWTIVDDKDGSAKSIIEIYDTGDSYEGRVKQVLAGSKRTHCEKCTGESKGKPLTGMVVLHGLKKTQNGGRDGKILNPNTGKFYSCLIELDGSGRLKVRGYAGVPAIGKTQYWKRVNN